MILLRLFKNNRITGMAGIFVFTLTLFVISMIRAEEVTGFSGMPFYNLIFGAVHKSPVLNRITAMAFMVLIGYMLIRIGARYVLLPIRSFMPALFFILVSAALPGSRQVSPALVGSIFYIFCFAILFDVNDKPPDTFSVFTAGIFLALGGMFYLKLIWFLPLIWISLGTLRTVTWRELLYPVIAYILMGLFLFTWYWGVMDQGARFSELITRNLAFEGSLEHLFHINHFSVLLYYGFIMLLVIAASVYMIVRFQSRKTVVQNIYQVLFYIFIAGVLFFTLIARFETAALIFIAFPVSYILSNFFHRKQNPWTHELILWILVGLLVFMQWMT
jgi:hypothetical protein